MWEIWTNQLLPKALKSCPMSNKLPNLVTLVVCYRFPNAHGPSARLTAFLSSTEVDVVSFMCQDVFPS